MKQWIYICGCCCGCCSLMLIVNLIVTLLSVAPFIFALLMVSRERPAFNLDDLHVSLLNKTLESPISTTKIHFNLTIENSNILYGLYYQDPLNLTFTYFPSSINKNTNVTIGRYTIQGFYQGKTKVKHVQDFVVVEGMFCKAKQLTEPAKVAILSVDLDGRVKFHSIEHRKLHLVAVATVEVNCNTGGVVQNKTNIRLQYTSGSDKWTFLQRLAFTFLLIIFSAILLTVKYNYNKFMKSLQAEMTQQQQQQRYPNPA